MTAIAITGMGLTGVLRITWVQDNLAHVLDHSQTDETSGTWTGLACPGHGLAAGRRRGQRDAAAPGRRERDRRPHLGSPRRPHRRTRQVFQAAVHARRRHRARRAALGEPPAIWSQAWSANYAVLEFMQGTGLTRFAPVKPQHWVVASFEHHTSPHGLPRPHIHNIAITSLTTSTAIRLTTLHLSRFTKS